MDTPRIETEHYPHGFDELRLGEARDAEQKCVAAGKNGHKRLLDDLFLSEDHRCDRGFRSAYVIRAGFGGADDHVFELFEPVSADSRHD